MPANRSRTLEWRRCLRQVSDRNGSLEIAVAQNHSDNDVQHLVWRVRLLGMNDAEIIVEHPSALGQAIPINQGIEMIVILSIGQNRWMFSTINLGPLSFGLADRKTMAALRLLMPDSVQRCQRRSYYRVETAEIKLPQVEVWPLLDPKSVLVTERAYEIQWDINSDTMKGAMPPFSFDCESVMPDVGPRFTATLLNLGGGGVGLRVHPQDAQTIARHKLLWMRITLPTTLIPPICATGKVVHTHVESNHDLYAGLAFDFSFNPSHQRFVVDQICRYIALQQRSALHQSADEFQQRQTA